MPGHHPVRYPFAISLARSAFLIETYAFLHRWYRPPELLFGSRAYSGAVDIWSVGCIFAELMLRVPFLAGETDLEQLKKTFQALGSPTEADWPVSIALSASLARPLTALFFTGSTGSHQASRLRRTRACPSATVAPPFLCRFSRGNCPPAEPSQLRPQ